PDGKAHISVGVGVALTLARAVCFPVPKPNLPNQLGNAGVHMGFSGTDFQLDLCMLTLLSGEAGCHVGKLVGAEHRLRDDLNLLLPIHHSPSWVSRRSHVLGALPGGMYHEPYTGSPSSAITFCPLGSSKTGRIPLFATSI